MFGACSCIDLRAHASAVRLQMENDIKYDSTYLDYGCVHAMVSLCYAQDRVPCKQRLRVKTAVLFARVCTIVYRAGKKIPC